MEQQQVVLVSAPNKAGEEFIRRLMANRMPFAAIANNRAEQKRLEDFGVNRIILLDTTQESTWLVPDFPIGKVFLFESSLNLSCRYIRVCRTWTSRPIYVITRSANPRLIYKGLGASYVIYTNGDDVSFLIDRL